MPIDPRDARQVTMVITLAADFKRRTVVSSANQGQFLACVGWASSIQITQLLKCIMQYILSDNSLPVLSSAQRCANSLGKPLQQIWFNAQKIARQLPHLLKEINIDFGTSDKIFSSQWLSETEVLIGSKCNKVAGRL